MELTLTYTKDPLRILFFSDVHGNERDERAYNLMRSFSMFWKPHLIIDGGDVAGNDSISHWKNIRTDKRTGAIVQPDPGAFDAECDWVDRSHFAGLRRDHPGVPIWFVPGNHDGWIPRMAGEVPPSLHSKLNWVERYGLKRNRINFKPLGESLVLPIGPAKQMRFTHGILGGKRPATSQLGRFETSGMSGHAHRFDEARKWSPLVNDYLVWTSNPCLCKLNPDYQKDDARIWDQGFSLLEWNPYTKRLTRETILIQDGMLRWRNVQLAPSDDAKGAAA